MNQRKKMKKSIPIAKLQEEARKKKVSVYLLVKRFLNYRKVGEKDHCKNCLNCKAVQKVPYKVNTIAGNYIEEVNQCIWIGIIKDFYTFVDKDHVCNFHDRKINNYKEK